MSDLVIIIHCSPLLSMAKRIWPERQLIDHEWRQKTDANNKRVYSPLLQFEDAAATERWNRAIVGALAAAEVSAPAGKGAP